MLCLWNAGIQDNQFYFVYKLNEHAKIKVFTPFGETRMFEVDDIVKQGTILGPNSCNISTEIFYWGYKNWPTWIFR